MISPHAKNKIYTKPKVIKFTFSRFVLFFCTDKDEMKKKLFNSLTLAIGLLFFYLVFLVFFLFIYWESRSEFFLSSFKKKFTNKLYGNSLLNLINKTSILDEKNNKFLAASTKCFQFSLSGVFTFDFS